jgi:hypothetical protein
LTVIPLEIGKDYPGKHGLKTLAECGGICGVDDTSSYKGFNLKNMQWLS